MNAHFTRYRLSVEVLSAIHVGSGETIDPTEYYFDHYQQASYAVVIDHSRLLSRLTPRQRLEFRGKLDQLDLKELGKWIRDQARNSPDAIRCKILVNGEVARSLEANFENPKRSGTIDLLARHPGQSQAFLPGSSIKGAIRTAILAQAAKQFPNQQELKAIAASGRGAALDFEAITLGYMRTNRAGKRRPEQGYDPLRQLAITDLPVPDRETVICEFQVTRRRSHQANESTGKIQIHREVISGPLLGGPSPLHGEVRLQHQLARRELSLQLSLEFICQACNEFYQPRLNEEISKFVTSKVVIDSLEPGRGPLPPHQCLIRIGRHSHVECVTVGPPWSQQSRGGKSRTYIDGKLPLGWALLKFTPEGN
jgi:CRISPR type III-A/MTUBE-associated RAMP protein Csm5